MPDTPRYIIGIDLGTTHTVVSYADTHSAPEGERPRVLPFEVEQLVAPGEVAARPLLPSVRYHPAEGELPAEAMLLPWRDEKPGDAPAIVGTAALELGAKVPGRLVASAKSWLSHASVDRTAEILPWGAPAEVSQVSPVAASASYLRHVRSDWDRRFPDAPLAEQEVVLTVPASFDEAARALTLQAARQAGLPKVRLVEEPQAAFYSWLDTHRDELESTISGMRLAIVVDVGGGTTDLTLIQVELRESGPRVTRIAVGDHLMLGGDNMDLALAKRAEPRIASGKPLGSARFHQLIARTGNQSVFITLGSAGAADQHTRGGAQPHRPLRVPVRAVVGARRRRGGQETPCCARPALAMSSGLNVIAAGALGSVVAAVAVSRIGNVPVTPEEVAALIGEIAPHQLKVAAGPLGRPDGWSGIFEPVSKEAPVRVPYSYLSRQFADPSRSLTSSGAWSRAATSRSARR